MSDETPTPSTQTEGDGIDEILKRLESGSNVSAVDEERDKMRLCAELRRLRQSAEPVGTKEVDDARKRFQNGYRHGTAYGFPEFAADGRLIEKAYLASRSLLVQREKELERVRCQLEVLRVASVEILRCCPHEFEGEARANAAIDMRFALEALTPNPEARV